jgi:DNA-binding beta-propeller fold protein YncE
MTGLFIDDCIANDRFAKPFCFVVRPLRWSASIIGSARLIKLAPLPVILLAGAAVSGAEYLGPAALVASPDGTTLYVALADAQKVVAVEISTEAIRWSADVPNRPTGLVRSPDGTRLYVTCAGPISRIVALNAGSGRCAFALTGGHTATGPALSPDASRLYVCNRFDHEVSILDLLDREEVARVAVNREPLKAAVSPDGKTITVIHHLPAGPADRFFTAPSVAFIDTGTYEVSEVALPDGATAVRDLAMAQDGRHVFVTHVLANYQLVPAQVVGGWTNINALSILDVIEKKRINTVQLDEQQLGAGNPWGVACDRRWIGVVHSGSHELSVMDVEPVIDKFASDPNVPPLVGGIPNRFGELAEMRRRIPLEVKGPRAIAVAETTAYIAGYFSDSLEVVDLASSPTDSHRVIPLGPEPQVTAERRGEMLFHDATICYQQWQSCASCHPDARVDALNWDLLNDGVGNPKNTKSMLLAHRTPPAMSLGVRESAESAVRSGLEHILFAHQPNSAASAIDAYLESLRPVPSPYLVDGRLSHAARRGRELFESDKVGCRLCHPEPLYTDLLKHDVGTLGPYDFVRRIDTPTLIEVWRTAPYLHDGRYASIRELIVDGKHGSTHGKLEALNEQERSDLIEFVLSL